MKAAGESGLMTRAHVEAARRVVAPWLPATPLRRAAALADAWGPGGAWLKLECWQPTGSFKVRGALHALATLAPEAAARGVVAASAGNHALGVAWAAATLGAPVAVTLFVPRQAPSAKLDKLRRFPVRLEVEGAHYEEAHAAALEFARRSGAHYLHAFDQPATAAGQGTLALELEEQLPDCGTLLVPVGGGGLCAGIAAALGGWRPRPRLVAVQAAASPALRESLRRGRALLDYASAPTLADGLAGGIGELVFAQREQLDEVVEVTEDELEDAVVALLEHDQIVAEGAGAAAVAALRSGRVRPLDARPAVAIVTGANLDVRVLARLLARQRPAAG